MRFRITLLAVLLCMMISCGYTSRESTGTKSTTHIIDSSYFSLDDSLYAKTYYSTDNQLGALSIYRLKEQHLDLIQCIDSLDAMRNFGIDKYEDYNSDRKKDLLLIYGTGARGGNALNYLFVRKQNSDSFVFIKGSQFAPNLNFNKERNVIESMVLTGSTTFDDYIINADSLIHTYSVDVSFDSPYTIREYSEISLNGISNTIKRDSVLDDYSGIFSREP